MPSWRCAACSFDGLEGTLVIEQLRLKETR